MNADAKIAQCFVLIRLAYLLCDVIFFACFPQQSRQTLITVQTIMIIFHEGGINEMNGLSGDHS